MDCVRLCCTLCLLENDPSVIEPDVLSKDRARFQDTGDEKYIELAKRFNHRAVFEPLEKRQDILTGLHANTQIPKIVGLERIAALTEDVDAHAAADFFWHIVTENRSVAFGGNSGDGPGDAPAVCAPSCARIRMSL